MKNFLDFLEHLKNKYNITFQFNNKVKLSSLLEKIETSTAIKKDVLQKLSHPIIINNKPTFMFKDKPMFISKNLTTEPTSSILNYELGVKKVIENEYTAPKTLTGMDTDQYISKQSLFSDAEFFTNIKATDDYKDEILEQMHNFFAQNGKIVKENIDTTEKLFLQCLSDFSKVNDNVYDHIILCNKYALLKLSEKTSKTISFFNEAYVYDSIAKTAKTTYEIYQYINDVLLILPLM